MTKFICISGKAGSGKDTVASLVKSCLSRYGYNVLIAHYADLLKYVCRTFLNWDGIKDEYGRGLLQFIGTDIVRKHEENYWVKFIADMIDMLPCDWDYAIMADARFDNEISYLQQRGFDVIHIRVDRKEFESALNEHQLNHASEISLDDYSANYIIENNSIEELEDGVETICWDFIDKQENELEQIEFPLDMYAIEGIDG